MVNMALVSQNAQFLAASAELYGACSIDNVFMSLVLPECSRNNEIRYVSLRYGWSGKRPLENDL